MDRTQKTKEPLRFKLVREREGQQWGRGAPAKRGGQLLHSRGSVSTGLLALSRLTSPLSEVLHGPHTPSCAGAGETTKVS